FPQGTFLCLKVFRSRFSAICPPSRPPDVLGVYVSPGLYKGGGPLALVPVCCRWTLSLDTWRRDFAASAPPTQPFHAAARSRRYDGFRRTLDVAYPPSSRCCALVARRERS